MIRNFLLFVMTINVITVVAQNYHAIQGSPYAGSLGIHNNPAAALMTPYKWDLTVLGVQGKSSTNFFTIYNYSLLSNPANSQYQFNSGEKKRFAIVSVNLNLLNARIAINRKSAVALGVNFKSISNLSTSPYNFIDTLKSTGDFFKINSPQNEYSGKITSASWIEIYASYSRTLIDDGARRLNAGITVKINKGLSGAQGELKNGRFQRIGDNRYNVSSGGLDYRYSSNFDQWSKNNSTTSNLSNLLQNSDGGISFDAGFEYIVKPSVVKVFDEEDDYYDYEWKLGLSLLDAGYTQYRLGNQSRRASTLKADVTNIQLDDKFDSTITSLAKFNDSLATIVDNFAGLSGQFKIINPMRIVVNVDRFIYKNFYINAELSFNVPGSLLNKWYTIHEMNLLTVTPRWETAKFGIYLPVQVTNTNRLQIGGGFKAGPLLLGIHNWANVFTRNSIQNGGGYLALIIHNLKSISKKYDRRLNCPAF